MSSSSSYPYKSGWLTRRRRLTSFISAGILISFLYLLRLRSRDDGIKIITPDEFVVNTARPLIQDEIAPPPRRPAAAQAPKKRPIELSIGEAQSTTAKPFHEMPKRPLYCNSFPDGNIAVVVKTGATEALARLPGQLRTSLRCVREPMFFSDLQQSFGTYQIHDVLEDFPSQLMESNNDFNIYRLQQQYMTEGREQDIPQLSSLPMVNPDWRTPDKNAAWELDKYKFLPMIERAWKLQPGRDWYVFIEADTYLSFPNLVRWLAQYDPAKKLYFGKPVPMIEHSTPLSFGYGGAGIVLSGAAVREFCVQKQGISQRFASRVYKWWFGDFILADALDEELNLRVTNALPHLNADAPDMVPFDDSNWCQPVVTLHHMDSRYIDMMYRAEKNCGFTEFLARDVYFAAYPNGLPVDNRADWNAADHEHHTLRVPPKNIKPSKPYGYVFHLWDPHEKIEACELACTQHTKCFQWSFTEETTTNLTSSKGEKKTQCYLSAVFRLGIAKSPKVFQNTTVRSYKSWTSGWSRSRVERFIDAHWACGDDAPLREKLPDEKFNFHADG